MHEILATFGAIGRWQGCAEERWCRNFCGVWLRSFRRAISCVFSGVVSMPRVDEILSPHAGGRSDWSRLTAWRKSRQGWQTAAAKCESNFRWIAVADSFSGRIPGAIPILRWLRFRFPCGHECV